MPIGRNERSCPPPLPPGELEQADRAHFLLLKRKVLSEGAKKG